MRAPVARESSTLAAVSGKIASAIVLLSLCVSSAFADVSQATIRGSLTIDGQPGAAGTTVTAVNADAGYSRSVGLSADGSYVFRGLSPGRYQLSVDVDGRRAISDTITVRVGQAASLDLEVGRPAAGAVIEEIVVVGTAVTKDFSSQTGTYVTPEQMERIPQVTRNFLSFADQAPGVSVDQGSDGSVRFRAGAQSSSAVNVFIDGVSQKDYVLRGGISGQDSSRGSPFPQSAIAEYQVISSNYKAEYDQVSSAAITAVTRSGSNEFHGGVFYDFTDSGLRAKTPLENQSGEKAEDQQEQYGLWVAGPIISDKLHYFFSYEAKENEDLRSVTPDRNEQYFSFYPQFLQDAITDNTRSVIAPFSEDLYFGKVSWQLTDRQFIDFTVKYRTETELTSIGGRNTPDFGTDKDNDETRIALKHQYMGDDFVNDLIVTFEESEWNPRARSSEPGARYSFATGPNSTNDIINLGGGPDFQLKGQDGWSIQNDFSFSGIEWAGHHTFKTGVKYKSIELSAIERNPFNPQFLYSIDVTSIDPMTTTLDAVPYRVQFGAPLAGIGDGAARSSVKQFGIYIQDDWDVTDRLTLFLGVRWDYEENPLYENYQTPQDVRDAIAAWNNVQITTDYNIDDYISTGSERSTFDGAWQPRLGFSFAINDLHTLVGGYGRSYDRNQFDFLQLETTKGTFPRYEVNFLGDHQFDCNDPCVPWDDNYLQPGGLDALIGTTGAREVFLLNNDLKVPYSDQISVALRSIWGDWETEIGFTHVESKDGFAFLFGNRRPDGNFFAPGTTWGPPWGDQIPSPTLSNLLIGTNGLETRSDALHIKAEKPHFEDEKWGASITYTYTDAEEQRQFNEVFALDYPGIAGYGWNGAGGVSDHTLVATFTYDLPWDIGFGAKLRLKSAPPFYGVNCIPGWTDCEIIQGYQEEGSALIGDWAFRQLDMSLSKRFGIADGSLALRLDVLNVGNTSNYDGFNGWYGGAGESPNPDFGLPNGNIRGPKRTIKLSVAYDW